MVARHPLGAAACIRLLDRVSSGRVLDPVFTRRAADARELREGWQAAPFARYFVNTVTLVTMILAAQLVLVTPAAYAFARFEFPGRDVAFALVLVQ